VSLPVFYLSSASTVAVGSTAVLDGPEGHHAATVRRLRVGEKVVLTDGEGTALDATVTSAGRREVALAVTAARTEDAASIELCVVQAIAKGDRGERAVELLTEVGVDLIVPWQAERCVSRWLGDKADRGNAKWQAVAAEAAKQSRRVRWPRVEPLATTTHVAAMVSGASAAFVLHESAGLSMAQVLEDDWLAAPLEPQGRIVLIVGPEGGITDAELDSFGAAGAKSVRLSDTVLRTSTAGVVGASLLLARTPGWRRSTLDTSRDVSKEK
jgi:16S rRNA (uracil1498-N3)-methyltransferase